MTKKTKQLPPCTKPYIGCLNCGGGEMKQQKDKTVLASLRTRIYNGFGGWHITCDGETVYSGPVDLEWNDYPTLLKFELAARKREGDWRAILDGPMRDAEYQRQGKNRWVLVRSGQGFA